MLDAKLDHKCLALVGKLVELRRNSIKLGILCGLDTYGLWEEQKEKERKTRQTEGEDK